MNIESLNVSASSIPGLHKYTITAWSDEDQIVKITKQIEKKIDVVKAKYYTDDELFFRETGLYKLSTSTVLENPDISRTIRKHGASIVEVNPTYVIVMLNGMTEEVMSLFHALNDYGCVFQYTRSGRIAVTRSKQEEVSTYLEEREGAARRRGGLNGASYLLTMKFGNGQSRQVSFYGGAVPL